jgi:predicted nucleic acid-binding protein
VVHGPERVVLDTNVLLSGVLFGGKPAELIEAARRGSIRAVTSLYILREYPCWPRASAGSATPQMTP